jgi:hypothetical protein
VVSLRSVFTKIIDAWCMGVQKAGKKLPDPPVLIVKIDRIP